MKDLGLEYKQLLVWIENLKFECYVMQFQAEPVIQANMLLL